MNVTVSRRRGPKPSQEKRQAILAAAIELFSVQGVDATGTREIAEHAATTERTLFKHFTSKEGLVQAVIQEVVIDSLRAKAFARIWEPASFTRDEFARWHRAFLSDRIATAQAAPENYRILFRELFRDDRFREAFAPRWIESVFEPFARQLGRMQETGEISRARSPRALASTFFSLTVGYLVSRFVLMPHLPWDDEGDVENVVQMFASACR